MAVVSRRGTADDDSMQSRDLSAFAQLTPHTRPAMPCSPERHRHYSALMLIKAGPGSVTYDFSNVFRHIR